MANASLGWIAGYCAGGTDLQRSRDGGRTWQQIDIDGRNESGGFADPPRFFTVSDGVMSAGIGSARGTRSVIYTTTDGGARWTLHEPPSSRYGAVSFPSAHIWFVLSGRTLFKTVDGGRTWTSLRAPITPGNFGGYPLDFVTADDGWVISSSRHLWHTRDGGHNWSRL